ncbi:MAG: HDOD domain-containing protein [Myxococcales bacterium]|nr:HDOD domain-containing protein [Myxococcales bacterium]
MRVLFVDDDPHALERLEDVVRHARVGWESSFAWGAYDALERLEQCAFDVLVTDARVTGVEGASLLAEVGDRYPDMARLVLFSSGVTREALHALPMVHQLLEKPCDARTLAEAIEHAGSARDRMPSPAVQRLVGGMRQLPGRPAVFAALTEALGDPTTAFGDIAAVVERDVGVAAKLVQVANTAYFSRGGAIGDVRSAVTRLGVRLVRDLVLATEVFAWGGAPASMDVDAVHRRGLRAAAMARAIARSDSVDDAFLAGLLHDVGTLVLAREVPDAWLEAQETAAAEKRPVSEVERERLGASHAEVGAYLLGLWGLPYPCIDAVAAHHGPLAPAEPTWPDPLEGMDATTAVHVATHLAVTPGSVAEGLDAEGLALRGLDGRIAPWCRLSSSLFGAEEE